MLILGDRCCLCLSAPTLVRVLSAFSAFALATIAAGAKGCGPVGGAILGRLLVDGGLLCPSLLVSVTLPSPPSTSTRPVSCASAAGIVTQSSNSARLIDVLPRDTARCACATRGRT